MHDVILYVYSAWDNAVKLRTTLNPPTYAYIFTLQVLIAKEVYSYSIAGWIQTYGEGGSKWKMK